MEQQWKQLLEHVSPEAASLLGAVAARKGAEFADRFYKTLLQDERSGTFVTHEAVDSRLNSAFTRWITHLFTRLDVADIPSLQAEQQRIGVVHARLAVPIDLVLRAARHMKDVVIETILNERGRYRVRFEAATLAINLIDVAMEIMSAKYSASHDSATRTDEAYRNYAATMNLSLEREYQRTALSDWSNRLLQDVMIGGADVPLSPIGQSSFGLWIRHKGQAIFTAPSELEAIRTCLDTIDNQHLPEIEAALTAGDAAAVRRTTRLAIAHIEQARHLLDTLFDHRVRMESGSDALTHLLNRRFLPSILGREIHLARSRDITFSVMLIDIDHFKAINDRYGHSVGDLTLQHVAQMLSRMTGSGDFLFRYGGEEFLIVCAEFDALRAQPFAERIRHEIASQPINVEEQAPIPITVSIGVATYDGHPDYQRVIHHADKALYHAKATGRNRTVSFMDVPEQNATVYS